MKFRTITLSFSICAVAALAIPMRVHGQAEKKGHHHYKLFDLGSHGEPGAPGGGLEGDGPSSPQLNNRGMLTGAVDSSTPDPNGPNMCFFDCFVDIGFVWQDGVVTPLRPFPGGKDLSSYPTAINIFGQIVGQAQNGGTDPLTGWPEARAVLWERGQIVDLGTLGGNQSTANAINDFGQVVGASLTTTPDPFANDLLAACQLCSGGTFAFNFVYTPGATETHAFVWRNGFMRDLKTLGGPDSSAWINNDRGEVAGESFVSFVANPSTGVPTVDPFFWSPEDGKMTDLGGSEAHMGFPFGSTIVDKLSGPRTFPRTERSIPSFGVSRMG